MQEQLRAASKTSTDISRGLCAPSRAVYLKGGLRGGRVARPPMTPSAATRQRALAARALAIARATREREREKERKRKREKSD